MQEIQKKQKKDIFYHIYLEAYQDEILIGTNMEYLKNQREAGTAVVLLSEEAPFDFAYCIIPEEAVIRDLEKMQELQNLQELQELQELQCNPSNKELQSLLRYLEQAYCHQKGIPFVLVQVEGFRLREFALADLKMIREIYDSPLGRQFLEPFYQVKEEAGIFLKDYIRYHYPVADLGMYGGEVFIEGDWTLVGIFGMLEEDEHSAVINYALHPSYYGRGYATKLVQLSLTYIKELDRYKTVKAYFDEENHRSKQLLQRVGFMVQEGMGELVISTL